MSVSVALQFLLELNISFGVLLMFYFVFLKRLTHFSWSRMYIIAIPFISLAIASVNVDVDRTVWKIPSEAVLGLSDLYPSLKHTIEPEVIVNGQVNFWKGVSSIFLEILLILLAVGALISVGRLIYQWMILRWRLSESSFHEELGVYLSNAFGTAFAFNGRVYVSDDLLRLPDHELELVILHERAHLELGHGHDNLVISLFRAIFWYNPGYHFLERELRLTHEFQADQKCGGSASFAYSSLLLKLNAPSSSTTLIHPFSKSLIKKRVFKLNQIKSSVMKKVLYLLALPLVGCLFYAFSLRFNEQIKMLNPVELHISQPLRLPISSDAIKEVGPFGQRMVHGAHSLKFHRGIDLVAPHGVDIYASASGRVTKVVRDTKGYGFQIEIRHENRLTTRYAHLSEILVRAGQEVVQGEVIGKNGSTGKSTGPHLHFEVLKEDSAVNPELFLDLSGLSTQRISAPVDRSNFVVYIDPGHGGEDAGSVHEVLAEKHVVLEYAQALEVELESRGVQAQLVRSEDEALSLSERTDQITSSSALYLSLHANESGSPNASGFEIYVPTSGSNQYKKSLRYAVLLKQELENESVSVRNLQEANFWVLREASCPSVVLELGFISSAEDRKKLVSSSYQSSLVGSMADAIDLYAQ